MIVGIKFFAQLSVTVALIGWVVGSTVTGVGGASYHAP